MEHDTLVTIALRVLSCYGRRRVPDEADVQVLRRAREGKPESFFEADDLARYIVETELQHLRPVSGSGGYYRPSYLPRSCERMTP